nr:hypothetical protein [Tanacetum cinerariifolium]
NPDGPQESSSVSSFVTSMLNPISDVRVESIFTTASSPIVSLQTPTPIMTPSIIATITTSGDAPIPPTTIPSIILKNLPTFNSAFRFDERLRIEESVNATLEAEVITRSSHSSRTSYAIAADLSEMELKMILIEKMEGNNLTDLEYHLEEVYKATTDQLDWVNPEDVYSKRRIIAVTELKIVEWHDYKHLDWILMRVEDLQLGVKSYQKRLNLTKPDTYRPDLKRREAYTAHSNPRGFIYQNKDKKNRLMRIDELHKFSDGTLNDVRNALDDRLKEIRMQYLPTTIWRRGDKDRAAAMI